MLHTYPYLCVLLIYAHHKIIVFSSHMYEGHTSIVISSGLKVGWMTRTIRVTFLVGQVGLIHKLNYLDVTRILIDHMFFRKGHWYLISEWTLVLVNALNHHWCETSHYLKLFWSMWYSEISLSRILCVGPVLYPKEIYMALFHIWFFPCHFTKLLKRKL